MSSVATTTSDPVVDGAVQVERFADVVLDEAEPCRRPRRGEVLATARRKVVDADDLVATGKERIAEMRTDEPGRTRHEDAAQTTPMPS